MLDSLDMELSVHDKDGNQIDNPADDAAITAQDPEARSYARLGDRITVTIG